MSMQSTSLKIISLNVEQDKHLDRIIPFLKEQNFDAILLQEALEKDISAFEKATGMRSIFTPLTFLYDDKREVKLGLLTLSAFPILKSFSAYYKGNDTEIPRLQLNEHPHKMSRAILATEILKENQHYQLLNTHFTWSPRGREPSEQQHKDLAALLQILSEFPEFILCGDFNSARGAAIFDSISHKYKDNIPSDITTTIDKNLHKAGDLNIVVDAIFTTPQYQVDFTKITEGLSDHCAILAQVKTLNKVPEKIGT